MKMIYKKMFLPNEYTHSVYDIEKNEKKQMGIKFAVFDLDGTLVPFDSQDIDERLQNFIAELNGKMGIGIYSDGSKERVEPVAKKLEIPYIYRARKPFGSFKTIHQMFPYLIQTSLLKDHLKQPHFH